MQPGGRCEAVLGRDARDDARRANGAAAAAALADDARARLRARALLPQGLRRAGRETGRPARARRSRALPVHGEDRPARQLPARPLDRPDQRARAHPRLLRHDRQADHRALHGGRHGAVGRVPGAGDVGPGRAPRRCRAERLRAGALHRRARLPARARENRLRGHPDRLGPDRAAALVDGGSGHHGPRLHADLCADDRRARPRARQGSDAFPAARRPLRRRALVARDEEADRGAHGDRRARALRAHRADGPGRRVLVRGGPAARQRGPRLSRGRSIPGRSRRSRSASRASSSSRPCSARRRR